jgi:flagellum-specific ATP synthase
VGAYVSGSNPRVDRAIRCIAALNNFLRQDPEQRFSLGETLAGLRAALDTAAVREEARRA